MDQDTDSADIHAAFDVPAMVRGLKQDLDDLRAGKISTRDAQTRADLAKQMFNGLRLIVQAQRFMSAQAKPVAAIEGGVDHG